MCTKKLPWERGASVYIADRKATSYKNGWGGGSYDRIQRTQIGMLLRIDAGGQESRAMYFGGVLEYRSNGVI